MEKIPGTELENLWEVMTGRQKYEIVKQLVGFEKSFASTRFRLLGSLYYAQDIPNIRGDEILCERRWDGDPVLSIRRRPNE